MSKATNQTMLLLSIVHGAYSLICDDSKDNPELNMLSSNAKTMSQEIINTYDETGDANKNTKKMLEYHKLWKDMIDEPNIDWPMYVLAIMAETIMTDLTSIIRNKTTSKMLSPLYGMSMTITCLADTVTLEEEYQHIETMKDVLKKLYKIIDFNVDV